jgi:hypothetical protein
VYPQGREYERGHDWLAKSIAIQANGRRYGFAGKSYEHQAIKKPPFAAGKDTLLFVNGLQQRKS